MYAIVEPVRKSVRQRDENLAETHLHEDLRTNSRVTIQKYKSSEMKRGL